MLNKIKNFLAKEKTIENYQIYLISIFGIIGHISYEGFSNYTNSQNCENTIITIIGLLTFLILAFYDFLPEKIKKHKNTYLHFVITLNLTFFFTYHLIISNCSDIWVYATSAMIFTTIMLIPNLKKWLINFIFGVALAIAVAYITHHDKIHLNTDFLFFPFAPIALLSIIAGVVFTKRISINKKSKVVETTKSAPTSVATEIHDQLNNINHSNKDSEISANQNSVSNSKTAIPSYKILIVDDQQANLLITKSRLEKYLPFISCEIALGGNKAIELFQSKTYNLILMDIQMPELDGISTTKEIRKIEAAKYQNRNQEDMIPIIAITSLDYETAIGEALESNVYFSDYLNKNSTVQNICRAICKWLIIKDQFTYLTTHRRETNKEENEWQKIIANQEIIVADDQEMNLKLTSRVLQKAGANVKTASNGKELLEIYKASIVSINENSEQNKIEKRSSFKVIVTDINMSEMSGDEAAREIRNFERQVGINYLHRVIIIVQSGVGEKKGIYHFLHSQIDDYFIKGDNFDNLTKIVAIYLEQFEADEKNNREKYKKEESKNSEDKIKKEEQEKVLQAININDEEGLKTKIINGNIQETTSIKNNLNETKNHPVSTKSAIEYYQSRPEIMIFNPEKIDFLDQQEQEAMIGLYVKDSKSIIEKLKISYQQNNVKELSFLIHSLKGISGNIGADRLAHYIKNIEPILKSNQIPSNKDWFSDLISLHNEFCAKKLSDATTFS